MITYFAYRFIFQHLSVVEMEPHPSEFERRSSNWLPALEDREYVRSLMKPVTGPGKIANWIAPAKTGVNHRPFEFEYGRL